MSYRKVVDQVRHLYQLNIIGKYSIADVAYPKPLVFGIALLSGGISIVPKDNLTVTGNSIDSTPQPVPQQLQPIAQLTPAVAAPAPSARPTTIETTKFVPQRSQHSQRSQRSNSPRSNSPRSKAGTRNTVSSKHTINPRNTVSSKHTINPRSTVSPKNTVSPKSTVSPRNTQSTTLGKTADRHPATSTPVNYHSAPNTTRRDRANSVALVLGTPEISTEDGVIVMRSFSQVATPQSTTPQLSTSQVATSQVATSQEAIDWVASNQTTLDQTTLDQATLDRTPSNAVTPPISSTPVQSRSRSRSVLSQYQAPATAENSASQTADNNPVDPELGNLQLQQSQNSQTENPEGNEAIDSELGNLQLQLEQLENGNSQELEKNSSSDFDPELGNLQLQQLQLAPPAPRPRQRPRPRVFLQGGIDFFGSSNTFFENEDPIADQSVNFNIGVFARPAIGPRTDLILSASGSLLRYNESSANNIASLQFRTGIRQYFSRSLFGQIGVTNRQTFDAEGDRLFNNYSTDASLSWYQPLGRRFSIEGFYQFQALFNESRSDRVTPGVSVERCLAANGISSVRSGRGDCATRRDDPSRITNTAALSLSYNFNPKLQLGVDYSVSLLNYTQREQTDNYHQLTAQLSYSPSRQTRINFFGGVGFGSSTNDSIGYDNTFLGVSLRLNMPLF